MQLGLDSFLGPYSTTGSMQALGAMPLCAMEERPCCLGICRKYKEDKLRLDPTWTLEKELAQKRGVSQAALSWFLLFGSGWRTSGATQSCHL